MKNVWFISGLGADERAFQFLDFSGWNAHFVQWILPERKESISDYARRLLPQIQEENPILVGYSFGGMIAIEIAHMIPTTQVIIVASVKTKFELPPYFRLASRFPIYKLLPTNCLIKPMVLYYWLFGVQSRADKKLLAEIIRDTNLQFLDWAIAVITAWQNTEIPNNIVHVHGIEDRVLPYHYVQADISISAGSHFMLVNKSAEISNILHQLID